MLSIALDWVIDQWTLSSSPPTTRLLDWLFAGAFYGTLVGGHGGPGFFATFWVVTTLILTTILYGLLSLVAWMLARGETAKAGRDGP